MPQRREHPYLWTTWLPRLLTGRKFVRVERLVQSSLPELGETALRLRPDRLADASYGAAQ